MPRGEPGVRIQVIVSPTQRDTLKTLADRQKTSVSEVVRGFTAAGLKAEAEACRMGKQGHRRCHDDQD